MKRPQLRTLIFQLSDGRCEHPFQGGRCGAVATEMAHIFPRGMGHTGYRDTIGNVIAACPLHARSTDDRSDPEWVHVPLPGDRIALAEWVRQQRTSDGWQQPEGDM